MLILEKNVQEKKILFQIIEVHIASWWVENLINILQQ
jgi:hypothetical protein